MRTISLSSIGVKQSDPLDDGGRAHAAGDTEGGERGAAAGALELVEGGAENHRAGGAEGVAEGDGAAVDVDAGWVGVEGLDSVPHAPCPMPHAPIRIRRFPAARGIERVPSS